MKEINCLTALMYMIIFYTVFYHFHKMCHYEMII